jgi:short subunit dehydrogenase-like uncharacterized protein
VVFILVLRSLLSGLSTRGDEDYGHPMADRRFDVVVFGATGFTGKLVAAYLARKRKTERFTFALAGRSRAKLLEVRHGLEAIDPRAHEIEVIVANVDDPASLEAMAAQARVVLTTVGPYALHGEPLVAACVAKGADYVDITGEPEFVDRTIVKYDEAARAAGIRIVSCCGFDSVPHDLGVLFTVKQVPKDGPITIEGCVRASGTFSGGTWQSAINAFAHPGEMRARARQARRPPPQGRTVRGLRPSVRWEKRLGAWLVPMPTIDPQVVLRSARAIDAYGPEFRYGHYAQVKSLATVIGGAVGIGAVVALAQLPPTRRLLERVRASGEGPSEAVRAKSKFRVTFLAQAGTARVRTSVSGGDPGYDETSKMLAESALCLALDREKLPPRTGVVTPAAGIGEPLIDRLQAAGIRFEVLERA